jgi:eukaryotic-like serine/threonine-protein kinase
MPDVQNVPADVGIEAFPHSIRDRFDVKSKLPTGAFGPSWLLQDNTNREPKVLRFIAPGPTASSQLASEMRLTAEAIGHCQNAVHVSEILDGIGGAWLLRDWIEGESLTEALRTLTVLTHEQSRTLIGSVCRGLLGHEQQHVVHGNLNPHNVLIDINGRVSVSDHGLRGIGAAMIGSKAIRFVAPEVIGGSAPTVLSDVYSLGAMLYISLCGIYPLPLGDDAAANQRILAEHNIMPPPRGVVLAGGIGNVIWRSFQFKPEDRYPTVEDFIEALSRTKIGEKTGILSRLQGGLIGD